MRATGATGRGAGAADGELKQKARDRSGTSGRKRRRGNPRASTDEVSGALGTLAEAAAAALASQSPHAGTTEDAAPNAFGQPQLFSHQRAILFPSQPPAGPALAPQTAQATGTNAQGSSAPSSGPVQQASAETVSNEDIRESVNRLLTAMRPWQDFARLIQNPASTPGAQIGPSQEKRRSEVLKGMFLYAIENFGKLFHDILLHYSANTGNSKAAETAIANGANIHSQDAAGNTALHLAAARVDREMVQFLLQNGANPHAVNHEGKRPIDLLSPIQNQ